MCVMWVYLVKSTFANVNIFRTIAFSVKNSKTMYMFLVLSKESVAFVTQCPRTLLNCHIYVNILNEIYKKKMQSQEISLKGALFC